MIVIDGNQSVAMVRDLRRSVRREIETETEKNLGALLQFLFFRYFMNAKFIPADGALSASVSQGVQFRADLATRTNQMARSVHMSGTHFVLEVRQQRFCIDYHRECGRKTMELCSVVPFDAK